MIKLFKRLFTIDINFKDVTDMAVAGEFIGRLLDDYIDLLVEKNKLKRPTEAEVQKLREKVLTDMQEKYPTAGVMLKKKEK